MRRLDREPVAVLTEALDRFHPRLVLACSFQKEESVLIDMLMRIVGDPRVFTIDTGVLFPETYAAWKKIEDRYGLKIEVFDASNPELPWTGGDHCCGTQKVAALEDALSTADARSEERRVGKECRSRWSPYHYKKRAGHSRRPTAR